MRPANAAIDKHIRNAWIAAVVSAAATLGLVIYTAAGGDLPRGIPSVNGWSLIDVAIVLGLAFGVAKHSRICAVGLVLYWILGECMMIASAQKPSPVGIVFIYFYVRGAIATFKYQAAHPAVTRTSARHAQTDGSLEAQLRTLASLRDDGIISEEEFTAKKRSLLRI